MAWFRNHYLCDHCDSVWADEWSCMCDDDCRHCGARHMSPLKSDNLTHVIQREGSEYVVLWSPETAEADPDYRELGRFPSRQQAAAFMAT